MAQLLRRPEIVIEDFTPVIAEQCPEFFHAVSASATAASVSEDEDEASHGSEPALTPDITGTANNTNEPGAVAGSSKLSSAARNEMKTVETEIKYAGYLDQQRKSMDRLKKAEQREIPAWFDYAQVSGLSREMNEKLQRVRPRTIGQASRIPGVTPAAVTLINVYIEIQAKRFAAAERGA